MVNKLTADSVQIKDNHFSLPLGPTDSNKGPLNFPVPEVRYLLKEISIVWHLYGGKDFGSGTFISSPARSRGSVCARGTCSSASAFLGDLHPVAEYVCMCVCASEGERLGLNLPRLSQLHPA